jgi:hypothetical protein
MCLQVKALLAGALAVAVCVISANKGIHDGLSSLLAKQERVEGDALTRWLENVEVSSVVRRPALATLPVAQSAACFQKCFCCTAGVLAHLTLCSPGPSSR